MKKLSALRLLQRIRYIQLLNTFDLVSYLLNNYYTLKHLPIVFSEVAILKQITCLRILYMIIGLSEIV